LAIPQSNRKYIVILIILLAMLVGLIGLYYVLTRPTQAVGIKQPKGYAHIFSIYGVGPDRLYRPTEVAVDKQGNLYVTDTFKNRVLVFDKNGKYVTRFGKSGTGRGEIQLPSAITVSDDGRIYVLQHTRNKITIFNAKKQPIWEINVPRPLAATTKDNKLYVTTDRGGVMIGDLNGKLLNAFGVKGRGKGQFNRPTGIAVDSKGNIYVADSINYRLSAYNKEGKHLWDVGSPVNPQKAIMSRERKFGLPVSVTFADDGLLYVMDAFNGEIYMFDTSGRQRGVVGEWGKEDGQFYYPGGIASMGGELFAVADKFNDRVQVVRIPSPVITPVTFARRYVPWFLVFLLIPLLALLRRRKLVFFADEAFLQRAIDDEKIAALAKATGRIYVTDTLYEKLSGQVHDNVKLGRVLQAAEYSAEDIEKLADAYGLSGESAKLFAAQMRFKKVTMLTEDNLLQKAADENDIVTLSYDEFISGLEGKSA